MAWDVKNDGLREVAVRTEAGNVSVLPGKQKRFDAIDPDQIGALEAAGCDVTEVKPGRKAKAEG